MESVSEQLRDKITNVKEFNITEEILEKETKKKKNCTWNRWYSKFLVEENKTSKKGTFGQVKDNNGLIPV